MPSRVAEFGYLALLSCPDLVEKLKTPESLYGLDVI
jgi:hypothetical protein